MRIEKVSVAKVKIGERVREDMGDLETLKKSIKEFGLIHPLIVDEKYNLISGQRRLQAVKDLGFAKIYVNVIDEKSRTVKLGIEIEENLVRKDFSEIEVIKGMELKKRLQRRSWFKKIWRMIKELFFSLIALFKWERK